MEQGVVFGRSMLGYDVCNGKMYINEKGAEIVRLIFHKFVREGKGTHVIARELREAGIKSMQAGGWQNTVILRIIRNEKYCGDLVQKKTYTPDFLSHDKKYNKGQEDFIIIKNHHEPIVPRKLFEEANRILDARSLSQEGKTKFSNRYPFSGKIKCGCCGASYVARYKSRKDGSQYKSWRCLEAVRYGKPHTGADGKQIGCGGISIRNDDVIYIMSRICRSLTYDKDKIKKNLLQIIRSVTSMAPADKDIGNYQLQMTQIIQKQRKLIDLYTSDEISKKEFNDMKGTYDNETDKLQSVISSRKAQISAVGKPHRHMETMEKVIGEILCGIEYEDEFYKQILKKIVVYDKKHVEVTLDLLYFKFIYIMK